MSEAQEEGEGWKNCQLKIPEFLAFYFTWTLYLMDTRAPFSLLSIVFFLTEASSRIAPSRKPSPINPSHSTEVGSLHNVLFCAGWCYCVTAAGMLRWIFLS